MRRVSRSPVLAGRSIQEADRFHIGAFVQRHFNLPRVAPLAACDTACRISPLNRLLLDARAGLVLGPARCVCVY
jgi:hypothetical protein